MKKLTLLTTLICVLSSCSSTKIASATVENDDKTALLIRWMTGSFSSAEQASMDKDYYNIVLHMYPIWIEREDGHWLYVEQAVSEMQHKPYRQRVYHVFKNGTKYESHVYELPNADLFVGKWRGGTEWDNINPPDLIKREGCEVLLSWNGQRFTGSTGPNTCMSTLRGASFATSEVLISEERIESWDRGYDAKNNQVWGAEKGAYIFKRLTDFPD